MKYFNDDAQAPGILLEEKGYWTATRVIVLLLAVLLVVFGFAIDGASAAGHHLGLILGGIASGWALKP